MRLDTHGRFSAIIYKTQILALLFVFLNTKPYLERGLNYKEICSLIWWWWGGGGGGGCWQWVPATYFGAFFFFLHYLSTWYWGNFSCCKYLSNLMISKRPFEAIDLNNINPCGPFCHPGRKRTEEEAENRNARNKGWWRKKGKSTETEY